MGFKVPGNACKWWICGYAARISISSRFVRRDRRFLVSGAYFKWGTVGVARLRGLYPRPHSDFYEIFLEKNHKTGIIYLAGDAQPYK